MEVTRVADVERYLTALLAPEDDALRRAAAASAGAGLPPHAVTPLEGKLLYLLARLRGARSILEIGALGGYSTIWLARALFGDGRLVTIEADPERAALAKQTLGGAGLGAVADVRCGRALDVLPELAREGAGPFDFVFLDADKRNNPSYLGAVLTLTAPGSVVVADNVVRGGAVADPAPSDPSVEGTRRFLEMVAAEPRLEATAIQTIGGKGHDGFAIALVRA